MTDQPPSPSPSASTDPTLQDRATDQPSGGRRRTLIIAGAGVVVLALVAGGVAIANSGGDDAAAATGGGGDPTSEVTVALQLFPDNLDIRTTTGAALDQVLIDNVYEGLVSRDAGGDVSPSLATDWTVSDDQLTYTFTLADGAHFSNGDALTSEDVVWSIRGVIDGDLADAATLASVADVTADGDDTVVVTLTQPDPTLLYNLAGRAGLVLDEDAENDLQTTAVGSGPFTVESFTAQDSLVLARDPDHWGEKAKVGTVVFQLFSDTNAILNAIQAGDIDVGNVDRNLADQLDGNADYDLVEGFASDKFTLAFNNQAAPFTDLRVRQAIRSAIDHDAIIEAVGGGNTLYGPIVESDPGYEDLSDLYPYDPDRARTLLAEAGYAGGLTLTLTTPSFYGTTVTDLLTSQLAQVGITLQVQGVEFPTWISDVFTNHDYQLSIVDHAEARDFANWANPDYYFGYDNPQVQELFAQASSAADEDTYADLLQQAARIVSQDAAADWLYNPTTLVAVRKGVTGVPTDSTSARLDLTQVEVTG